MEKKKVVCHCPTNKMVCDDVCKIICFEGAVCKEINISLEYFFQTRVIKVLLTQKD
jgi:hypothetical protein